MTQSKKTSPKVAVYILAFMAVIFTSVGGGFLYFTNDFVKNSVAVTGTVIDVSVSYSDNSTTYKPTISYVDAEGNKQTGRTFLSSSGYNFSRGSKVDILYDIRTPSDIRIDSWFALWGFPMIFLGVGLLLAFIAMIVALSIKKRGPKAARSGGKPSVTYGYNSNEPEEDRAPTVRRG